MGAALALTAVLVGAVTTTTPEYARAATPTPLAITPPSDTVPAATRLTRIAADIDGPSGAAPAGRPVEHLASAHWALHTQATAHHVDSTMIPTQRESWRTRDNAGRIIERHPTPVAGSDQRRHTWRHNRPAAGAADRHADYPAGQYPALWPQRPPTTVPALRAWLLYAHSGDGAVITAVADLLTERVLTGAERATLLRALAGQPGLTFAGTTVDRAGRPGQAYQVPTTSSGLPITITLVIDPRTGTILAHEHLLTGTTGRLTVRTPAVIRYDTYLTAEFLTAMP